MPLSETLDHVTLANRALSLFAGGVIESLDDEDDLTQTVVRHLDATVRECLSSFDFSWATGTRELAQLANGDKPPNGYRYGYAFPDGVLDGPFILGRSRDIRRAPVRDFTREGRAIFVDVEPPLYGKFLLRLSPDQWPDMFAAAVTNALAAKLVIPLSHDVEMAAFFEKQAFGSVQEGRRGGLIGRAMVLDLQTRPAREPLADDDWLTRAHRS